MGEKAFIIHEGRGYLNLAGFTYDEYTIDWDYMEAVLRVGIRALDNLKLQKNDRSSGLRVNVLGFADMLEVLKMKYIADKSVDFGDDVAFNIGWMSWKAAMDLANERGPYVGYSDNIDWDFIDKFKIRRRPIRFSEITYIKPDLEIADIAEATPGIEPKSHVGIHYLEKINMCAAWQNWIDGPVECTVFDIPEEKYIDVKEYADEMEIRILRMEDIQ